MLEMELPKSFWKQPLDQLSQKLLTLVPKQLLCLVIDQHDPAFGVDDHNSVRSRLQKTAKPCFSSCGTSFLLIGWMGAFSFDARFLFLNEAFLPV
jgi:hypothetical protein